MDYHGEPITVPTEGEILRIKGVLILKRNATRDYLDFVALADHMGDEGIAAALESFDRLYRQDNGESPLQQLQVQLANPLPYDLEETALAEYKNLDRRWHDWPTVTDREPPMTDISKDSAIPGLDREDAYQQVAAIPPPAEQAAIVRFLDWANGRLERAIRAKRKVIALLNEQKQAIIHRAVTRGLDPSVPLKPSGIPWLGDIPEHWEVRRLGHAIRLQTGFPFASSGFVQGESGTRLLRGINVTPSGIRWDQAVRWQRVLSDGLDEFALGMGDIALGMDRPIIGSGVRAATIRENDTPSLLLQRVARLRPTDSLDAKFLLLLLRGRLFRDYMAPIFTGISVPHLSPQQIKGFRVPLPSLKEQQAIVSHLEAETSGLDIAASRLEREIDLLREYRTRLVADVVTGKLDVREAAARLPDEAPVDTVECDNNLGDETEDSEA